MTLGAIATEFGVVSDVVGVIEFFSFVLPFFVAIALEYEPSLLFVLLLGVSRG